MCDLQSVVGILKQIRRDPRGHTSLEYALIAFCVVTAIVNFVNALGNYSANPFNRIADQVSADLAELLAQ
jgi:Flp pilus assembly pilin Flp